MAEEDQDKTEENELKNDTENAEVQKRQDENGKIRSIRHLSGMFETWFLDYASYVILERAVPYVNDGLKPVQRRILHAMKQMDDGRYNKVANIIGSTMQYHPHGDASIGDALVQLGQKNLLVDCQGNWGNILTGDSAAAPRYIEARLSKFALEVAFNPKTTNWKLSYDGRNKEPITLPVKFPLLLAQGVEGIAVGLASKILPHNFNELLDACIAYLKREDFVLYPDFPTGGMVDVSKYNDGIRGGSVKIRAKIEKEASNKILKITEIPYGRTTSSLIDSILKANEKGKIKIKKIDDNTAADVEILVHLAPGVSSDKTIDALYACTDCELSVSPNSCVIENDKPVFMPITDILKKSVDDTVALLLLELKIRLGELEADWQYSTLEKIFIEERIYKDKEFEESATIEAVIGHVRKRLEPFLPRLLRPVTDEDIKLLLEIKMKRILKFNSEQAENYIKGLEEEITRVKYNIEHIIPYTIKYYKNIKDKYGKGRERLTEIRNFENIEATKVVVANEKLYINREEGFIGTALKKDEFVCECSDIDDVIVFRKDGTYYVTKVADKLFVGKDVLYVSVFKKSDKRTIYNVAYRDGKVGASYVKRFFVTGTTRDKQYNLTKGTAGSRVLYFSANPNGEAEVIKVCLKPKPGMKKLVFEYDFANLAIKGRDSQGNVLSKNDIHKISLVQKGISTLGGRKIWFDEDILRLSTDERGRYLGEFQGDDRILVVNKNGTYYTSDFDLSNHYEEGFLKLEKFEPDKIWSVVFFDAEQQFYYLKRFRFEDSAKLLSFIGDTEGSRLVCLSGETRPRFEILFGGRYEKRPGEIIVADEFIAEKSYKARGKRMTTYEVKEIREIEPLEAGEKETTSEEEEGTVDFEITNPDMLSGESQMTIDFE
ncbi:MULTISPECIES: DNA gyrase/topoisomerase IV subunit A [Sanguibacteroides]|uniref:DNA topoisomerase IV subunit A n=1 Tax=Sanguibacteroides justesenii TaxID=1547597 RepID=A0A0C3MIY6_9PORP|nr:MULTISPECIES: DNA gyrase/topoisomerase IV subunit A [Sanguibacteroides]KIO46648.1 DNA topoisomerase IV subunit A [Sanguibacteroides justesenii]KIO46973.1 DNA topoisomerase IV subunit A [Sanguibacteroides justesenii]